MSINRTSKGQALIELLVAIAVAAVMLPALLTGLASSQEGKAQEEQKIQALGLLKEMSEAVRSIREGGWSGFATNNSGTFHPVVSGSSWALVSNAETIGNFSRQIVISNVQRDSNGNIVTSGGVNDPSTKQATYIVTWSYPTPTTISRTEYFQRYLNNTTAAHTTQGHFNGGIFDNTRTTSNGGGTVELKPGTGTLSFIDDYTISSNYTYDSSKIEVTGGYAQLKNLNSAGSGSTLNSDFTAGSAGWTFGSWGHNVGQTGTWQAADGNPTGYVNINFPADRNKLAGGYWYQPITTTVSAPAASLTFQYKIITYTNVPANMHLYVYIDTTSGSPTNQVWDSGNITSTSAWSGTVTVNTSSFMTTPGTYYLKIAAQVDYPNGNRGPFNVGYDNVSLTWAPLANLFANDSPVIYPTTSFTAPTLSSWTSFTETSILNGGSIRYQLSYDDGLTWYYHAGGAATNWVLATLPTHYNTATTVDQKISGFPTGSGTIRVKAFLISNGTQHVRLDKLVLGYTASSGNNNGTFTSSSIDVGSVVGFNRLIWTETNTANTTTRFKIATNTDNSSWSYVGPDGTGATYFTGGSGTLPLNAISGRYIRYEITFSSTNNDLPNVSDVTINYSP